MKKCFKKEWIDLTAGSLKLALISIALELKIAGEDRLQSWVQKE